MKKLVVAVSTAVLASCVGTTARDEPATAARQESFSLESRVFGNERAVRVHLPPGYDDGDDAYPMVVMLDGGPAFFGEAWNGPGAADAFWAAGGAPFVLIGIDNGGATSTTENPVVDRAAEFLPAPDPTWTEPPIPEPRGVRHPEFLFDEALPAVAARYRVDDAPVILVGASYGAIAALFAAQQRPDQVAALILESPSLQVDGARLIAKAEADGARIARVYVGVGGAEGDTPEAAADFAAMSADLVGAFRRSGTDVCRAYVADAEHWFTFWAARLPDALAFAVDGARQGLCAQNTSAAN